MAHRQEDILIPLPNRNGAALHTIISTTTLGDQRPTLMLLHFWGGSNRTYARLITQLQNKFNIVAPSLRGWGESSKPEDPSAYQIADYADDITDLLSSLHTERPDLFNNGTVLVGHSMGGKIAQILLTKPEFEDVLRGLVLIAPAPASSFQLPTSEMREQQLHAYDSLESARFVVENVLLGRPDAIEPDEVEKLAGDAFGGSEAAKKAWPDYGMGEDYGDAVINAVHTRSGDGGLKVLVVVGSLDQVETPPRVQIEVVEPLRIAGTNVAWEELEDVGHLSPVEAPELLAEAITDLSLKTLSRLK